MAKKSHWVRLIRDKPFKINCEFLNNYNAYL